MSQSYTQFYRKWFSSATPVTGVKGSINIGAGDNGKVIMNHVLVGTEGNAYTIQVAAGVGNNIALSATLTGKDILVTLGTGGAGALDNAKNTAILIAAAINALDGVTAVHTGTGADSITQAVAKTNFTGGRYATPVNCSCFIIIAGVWYIADAPVTKFTLGGWKSAEPA